MNSMLSRADRQVLGVDHLQAGPTTLALSAAGWVSELQAAGVQSRQMALKGKWQVSVACLASSCTQCRSC